MAPQCRKKAADGARYAARTTGRVRAVKRREEKRSQGTAKLCTLI